MPDAPTAASAAAPAAAPFRPWLLPSVLCICTPAVPSYHLLLFVMQVCCSCCLWYKLTVERCGTELKGGRRRL